MCGHVASCNDAWDTRCIRLSLRLCVWGLYISHACCHRANHSHRKARSQAWNIWYRYRHGCPDGQSDSWGLDSERHQDWVSSSYHFCCKSYLPPLFNWLSFAGLLMRYLFSGVLSSRGRRHNLCCPSSTRQKPQEQMVANSELSKVCDYRSIKDTERRQLDLSRSTNWSIPVPCGGFK